MYTDKYQRAVKIVENNLCHEKPWRTLLESLNYVHTYMLLHTHRLGIFPQARIRKPRGKSSPSQRTLWESEG